MKIEPYLKTMRHNRGTLRLLAVLTLLLVSAPYSRATDIVTIGKGSGIVWEGLPFNQTLTGPLLGSGLSITTGMIAISNISTSCINASALTTIAGYTALQIAPGVGLVPRATGSALYRRSGVAGLETLTGTIGLPKTEGRTDTGFTITSPFPSNPQKQWCLPPRTSPASTTYFYDANYTRTVNISGTWAMVADGNQRSGQVTIPTMYAGSYSSFVSGDRSAVILPAAITLRISTLACTIATTTNINFGGVQRNTQVGSELARLTYPLAVSCSQDSDRIDANINVQFRAISGLYSATPTRLALTQGGGYITGEINNGVTGSGDCNSTTGIPFDNTQLKVGSIASSESAKVLNNQVTWRLCSGGTSLPTGPVDASTEMLVTFN
ncbi:hypothetical protein [Serratia sp. D1N4]